MAVIFVKNAYKVVVPTATSGSVFRITVRAGKIKTPPPILVNPMQNPIMSPISIRIKIAHMSVKSNIDDIYLRV